MADADLIPGLLAGPILRHVDSHSATVWVETDRPGTLEMLGHTARTITVHGHHYAVVMIEDLEPDTAHPYTVRLDGDEVWPGAAHADLPDSVITTHPAGRTDPERWRIVFGSCRRIEERDDDPHPDALHTYAHRLLTERGRRLPDLLLMLGDQVYACLVSPRTEEFIRRRRGDPQDPVPSETMAAPSEQVRDFEEFTRLYREAWTTDRGVRWLLSTVPSAMIFDDHDIIDDWNISASWVSDMRETEWWHERVVGGLMAYWLYQHLGNLSPAELAADPTWRMLHDVDGDAGPELEQEASGWDRGTAGTPGARWSFSRRLGDVALLVVDSRNGRLLGTGERDMLDEDEWRWLEDLAGEDVEHLLIASSVPILLPRGMHDVEAWNEQLCSGAWGARPAGWGEWWRRALDLEHWAAFERGFEHMCRVVADKADGRSGRAPSSLLLLSGDVHCAYTLPVDTGPDQQSAVWQLTCSPMHHLVERPIKAGFRLGMGAVGRMLGTVLAGTVPCPSPQLSWQVADGPAFGSFLATLELDGPRADVLFEQAHPDGFSPLFRRRLTTP